MQTRSARHKATKAREQMYFLLLLGAVAGCLMYS